MSHLSRYTLHSSSVMLSLRVWICWVIVHFGPGGVADLVVVLVVLLGSLVVVVVLDSHVFELFIQLEFFGQAWAMYPWDLHLKHHSLVQSCAHSSSVSHLNRVVVAELMSIGTMFRFKFWCVQLELFKHWFIWYCNVSHDGWLLQNQLSPTFSISLTRLTSFHTASSHPAISIGQTSHSRILQWMLFHRPDR